MTDNLPAATTFVSCTSQAGGVCGGSGNNRTVTFASLAGGATATIGIVANVKCPVANGTSIANTVTISSATPDSDPSNNSASVTVVASNPPPSISSPSVNKPTLWPPDHKMMDVMVGYNVTDNCGAVTTALSVASNEPVNGLGDGDAEPDWLVLDSHHVQLRAERSGTGEGRTYTITIEATDEAGGKSSRTVAVSVPKNQR